MTCWMFQILYRDKVFLQETASEVPIPRVGEYVEATSENGLLRGVQVTNVWYDYRLRVIKVTVGP